MFPTLSRRRMSRAVPILLCAVFLTAQAQALAQPAPAVRRADPLDPRAAVPALRHESALAQYRRFSDDKTASWRDANDAVARIGGWRAYAREAQQPEAPASAPVLPAAKPPNGMPADMTRQPVPAGHGGHPQP
jgi:hypothetical protein